MAHGTHNLPLWDSRNRGEGNIVKFCPQHKNLLNSRRAALTDVVDPAGLWPHLKENNVLTKQDVDRIKVLREYWITLPTIYACT